MVMIKSIRRCTGIGKQHRQIFAGKRCRIVGRWLRICQHFFIIAGSVTAVGIGDLQCNPVFSVSGEQVVGIWIWVKRTSIVKIIRPGRQSGSIKTNRRSIGKRNAVVLALVGKSEIRIGKMPDIYRFGNTF
ncbi:hypothetical protein SDC9_205844 [bioreactor metagenome]|uniref:Uncharacterized protein n=1 Tax=bioreactor metagenome TaxID=1076179 RepID=A0A645JEW3_9ZZZZ